MRFLILPLIACLLSGGANSAPVNVQPGTVAGYMYLPKSASAAASSSPTLPVVTENAACTATTTSNTGVNSSYTKLLTCNGGSWKPAAADGIQTATAGNACTASTTNNIAISTDFQNVLSCRSGTWQRDPSAGCSAGYVFTGGSCQAISAYNPAAGCSAGYVYTGGSCQAISAYVPPSTTPVTGSVITSTSNVWGCPGGTSPVMSGEAFNGWTNAPYYVCVKN